MKVTIEEMGAYLIAEGWRLGRERASHQAWTKPGHLRPAILDVNYRDVPEDHLRTILHAMGRTRGDLRSFLGRK